MKINVHMEFDTLDEMWAALNRGVVTAVRRESEATLQDLQVSSPTKSEIAAETPVAEPSVETIREEGFGGAPLAPGSAEPRRRGRPPKVVQTPEEIRDPVIEQSFKEDAAPYESSFKEDAALIESSGPAEVRDSAAGPQQVHHRRSASMEKPPTEVHVRKSIELLLETNGIGVKGAQDIIGKFSPTGRGKDIPEERFLEFMDAVDDLLYVNAGGVLK